MERRIWTPQEDYLFELCRKEKPEQGFLFFIKDLDYSVGVASVRIASPSDIALLAGTELPGIYEKLPFITHSQPMVSDLYVVVSAWKSLQEVDIVEKGRRRPLSPYSSSTVLEQRVHALKDALRKAMQDTTPPLVHGSLETRRRYGGSPHDKHE